MTKVEEVARAIDPDAFRAWDQFQREPEWPRDEHHISIARQSVEPALEKARAAIKAMREPTPGQRSSGVDAAPLIGGFAGVKFSPDYHEVADIYAAMIDAALSEDKG